MRPLSSLMDWQLVLVSLAVHFASHPDEVALLPLVSLLLLSALLGMARDLHTLNPATSPDFILPDLSSS